MPTPSAASDFAIRSERLITAMLLAARQSWGRVPPRAIWSGWAAIGPQLVAQLAATQIAAAKAGVDYVPLVLEELGIPADTVATVLPQALAVGSSGMDLATVLQSVPLRALHVTSTDGPDAGLAAGQSLLEGIVQTQVADAGRLGTSLRTVASPKVAGYIREVSGGACSRCLVLAGRWYRWNSGFLRHPRCQCVHVPVGQAQGKQMVTDVGDAFRSMTPAQQTRIFTAAGAQAIRDGADINQVVNARRGVSVAGRTTREGTTSRGLAGMRLQGRARLMPEQIYAQAHGNRDLALQMLRQHGYLI